MNLQALKSLGYVVYCPEPRVASFGSRDKVRPVYMLKHVGDVSLIRSYLNQGSLSPDCSKVVVGILALRPLGSGLRQRKAT